MTRGPIIPSDEEIEETNAKLRAAEARERQRLMEGFDEVQQAVHQRDLILWDIGDALLRVLPIDEYDLKLGSKAGWQTRRGLEEFSKRLIEAGYGKEYTVKYLTELRRMAHTFPSGRPDFDEAMRLMEADGVFNT